MYPKNQSQRPLFISNWIQNCYVSHLIPNLPTPDEISTLPVTENPVLQRNVDLYYSLINFNHRRFGVYQI